MRLELIIGCMFSGKSTELIKRIRRHNLLNKKVLSIVHDWDQRYTNALIKGIITHDKEHIEAISLSKLSDIFDTDIYKHADYVCIEESQFFPDLYDSVRKMVEIDGKSVIVCGLDGDYRAQPFIEILRLIPLADSVTKLSGLCMDCADGTPGPFSKRLTTHESIVHVGGSDSYKCVCRKHF